jgi:hypothetical protein
MGASEAVAPPPELKRRVLAAVARTPQAPPPGPLRTAARARSEEEGKPSRRRRWLAAAAAAVVLAGAGAVGLRAVLDGDEPALSTAAVQVFEADDARTATVETTNGGRLTVAVSAGRGEMAVDTHELPDPGAGRVYQLWAVHGDETVSAGVLSDLDKGAAMGMPPEDTSVALTIEPAGGSEQPTSDPLAQVDPRDV